MPRFVVATLAYEPNKATGECINVGTLAGSDESGTWKVELVKDFSRAHCLGTPEHAREHAEAKARFLQETIDREDMSEGWIKRHASSLGNAMTRCIMKAPRMCVAHNVNAAIAMEFALVVIDPLEAS